MTPEAWPDYWWVPLVSASVLGLCAAVVLAAWIRDSVVRRRERRRQHLELQERYAKIRVELDARTRQLAAGKADYDKLLAEYHAYQKSLANRNRLLLQVRQQATEHRVQHRRTQGELAELRTRWDGVRKAALAVRDAKGHDSCQLNVRDLVAAVLGPGKAGDPHLPPLPEFLAGCARHWVDLTVRSVAAAPGSGGDVVMVNSEVVRRLVARSPLEPAIGPAAAPEDSQC